MSLSQQGELWLGPGDSGSAFESDEHRREVWFRYRDKLMQLWGKNGRRPYGWWRYEAASFGLPSRHPGDHQKSILYEFGGDALGAEERTELEREWKREFDRSWDEHFFYCAGPDKIFSGDDARWQHWLFVDLPPPLLEKFMGERQQRGLAICELQDQRGDSPHEAA